MLVRLCSVDFLCNMYILTYQARPHAPRCSMDYLSSLHKFAAARIPVQTMGRFVSAFYALAPPITVRPSFPGHLQRLEMIFWPECCVWWRPCARSVAPALALIPKRALLIIMLLPLGHWWIVGKGGAPEGSSPTMPV